MISIGGYLYYEKNTGYMYIKKEKYYIPLNYCNINIKNDFFNLIYT